jgi:hypothetical protein
MSYTLTTLKSKAGYNVLARLLEMLIETASKPAFGSSTLKSIGVEENKGMSGDVTIFSEFSAFEKLDVRPDFSAKFISCNPFGVLKEAKEFSLDDLKKIAEKVQEVNENITSLYVLIGATKPEKTAAKVERILPEALDGVPMVKAEVKPEVKPADTKK